VLYCDAPSSLRRRAARTVLDHLHRCLCTWLAPVLCFTAEEAWTARFETDSVHLQQFPSVPPEWHDAALAERWASLRAVRRLITTEIEAARRDGIVGSSLQAEVELAFSEREAGLFAGYDWEELAIVSKVELLVQPDSASVFLDPVPGEGSAVHRPPVVRAAKGSKCARCWKVLEEVGKVHAHPTLCLRCADVVSHLA
jgi:isoleucyl-tRNA synthetase